MSSQPHPWSLHQLASTDAIPRYVVDSWLAAYRNSGRAGVVPNNMFKPVYTEAIRQLWERGMLLVVAHNPRRPDHILGYLAHELTRDGVPVVHFAFVKDLVKEYKAQMMASMFEEAGIDPDQLFFVTFSTGWESKYPGSKYCPAIARRKAA